MGFVNLVAWGYIRHRHSEKRGTKVRRKFITLFVAAVASIFGAVTCSGEVQVEEPDEVPVQIQDGEQEEEGGGD
jgi:hypothetical protein